MRVVLSALLVAAGIFAPLAANAESADVEATIVDIDPGKLTLALDDGETYAVPGEFDFEGLERGVRVSVFYTEMDGKRIVNDLEVIQ